METIDREGGERARSRNGLEGGMERGVSGERVEDGGIVGEVAREIGKDRGKRGGGYIQGFPRYVKHV